MQCLIICAVIVIEAYFFIPKTCNDLSERDIDNLMQNAAANKQSAIMCLDAYFTSYETNISKQIDYFRKTNDTVMLRHKLLQRGTDADIIEAVEMSKLLAKDGNPKDIIFLMNMYLSGKYLEQNSSKALYWAKVHDCASNNGYKHIFDILQGDYSMDALILTRAIIADYIEHFEEFYTIALPGEQKELENRLNTYRVHEKLTRSMLSQDDIKYLNERYNDIICNMCQALLIAPEAIKE
jgi:hypothetical protein